MIVLFLSLGLATLLFTFLSIASPKIAWFIVPLVCVMWFSGFTKVTDYMGFALDDEFLAGRQGIVLTVAQTDEWFYVTIKIFGEDGPRLVRFEATEPNKEQMKKVLEQLQNGPSIIQIGRSTTELGDGTDSQPGMHTMDIADVQQFKKEGT